METAFVYVIACEGYHKVGRAADVNGRLSQIQVASPFPVTLVHAFKAPLKIAPAIEGRAHWFLQGQHHRGEWFAATADECIEAIRLAVRKVQADLVQPKRDALKASWERLPPDKRPASAYGRRRTVCQRGGA